MFNKRGGTCIRTIKVTAEVDLDPFKSDDAKAAIQMVTGMEQTDFATLFSNDVGTQIASLLNKRGFKDIHVDFDDADAGTDWTPSPEDTILGPEPVEPDFLEDKSDSVDMSEEDSNVTLAGQFDLKIGLEDSIIDSVADIRMEMDTPTNIDLNSKQIDPVILEAIDEEFIENRIGKNIILSTVEMPDEITYAITSEGFDGNFNTHKYAYNGETTEELNGK